MGIAPPELLALLDAKDHDALGDAAFAVMRTAVACDFTSALYLRVGDGLLRERDSRGRRYKPAFMRRYAELTPAVPMALANPGVKILTTRAALPLSVHALHRSAFYREVMRVQGWRHGVALCFWGEPRAEFPVFVASAYRVAGRRDFSDREVAALESVHPFIDRAVSRVHERGTTGTMRDALAAALGGGTHGVMVLGQNLGVIRSNAVARQLAAAWASGSAVTSACPSPRRPALHAELAEACRTLHARWQLALSRSQPETSERRRRHVSRVDARGVTADITLVCPDSAGLGEATFLVELHRRAPGPAGSPGLLEPLLQRMTAGERAVATVLADGLSNQEIADHLGKSVEAVKFLLHRIYQKMGVPNRTALVAALRS